MLEAFVDWHAPDELGPSGAIWEDPTLLATDGYEELMGQWAGVSFDGGLYRLHSSVTGPRGQGLMLTAFPELAGRVVVFGYDWLGRQFGATTVAASPAGQVLMVDVGAGQVLRIPVSFRAFHDVEIAEDDDASLAASFYATWRATAGNSAPLSPDECVGYKRPLFLGGQDQVENLERDDIEVYWSLMGQMRSNIRR